MSMDRRSISLVGRMLPHGVRKAASNVPKRKPGQDSKGPHAENGTAFVGWRTRKRE
jgi:hypothetical protein